MQAKYYAELYRSDIDVQFELLNMDGPKISNEERDTLESKISLEEQEKSMKGMQVNKTPGCDGLGIEIYRMIHLIYSGPKLKKLLGSYNGNFSTLSKAFSKSKAIITASNFSLSA